MKLIYNRNLTYIVVDLRRDLFWVSLLAAEMQWIIDILPVFLGSQQLQKSWLYQSISGWCKRGYLCQLPNLLSQAKDQNLSFFLDLSKFVTTVMYVDLYIIFSHYSVPTLDTNWLNLFNLIRKILYNLENKILNRNISENLTLISIYIKGNLLSHVMEQSTGDQASGKGYLPRFKCHV